jgi:hypothetical protein
MTVCCTVCNGSSLQRSLDIGRQPPSNRFLFPGTESEEECYSLSLGYCDDCGTIQLVDRMPIEAIRPRFDWLANSEPEGHLDDLTEKLIALPGINVDARVLGICYKDHSTLQRLSAQGFRQVASVTPDDLPAVSFLFGLETLQHSLSDSSVIETLRNQYGATDVLLVRHMVEHAESAARFLTALRDLLVPGGYMVVEFPDNERILQRSHHAFIWEEHFSYFTESSFRNLANRVGATVVRFERYRYPFEDALVAVLRFDSSNQVVGEPNRGILDDLQAFAESYPVERARWHDTLSSLKSSGEAIAVFGAGHLAVKVINFMGLAPFIDCVIDDHPKKTGLRMPGSHLPIVPSSDLVLRNIRTCISTVSPESEIRVRQKLTDYFKTGGRFIPAFPVT